MAESGPPPLLTLRDVSAGYGGVPIVRGVTLDVQAGDFLGLLGANGAGKSTLLRAITGQIPLLSGQVLIAGVDLAHAPQRAKSLFGYAVDTHDLPMQLTPCQYIDMVASIRGCRPDAWPVADLPGHLQCTAWWHEPIADCSLGTRTKIAIAAALLGLPKLIILDESLSGLDPVASWRTRQMLRGLLATGHHAVLLCTHVLETVAAACTRAIFLQEGKITHTWNEATLKADVETQLMQALGEPQAPAKHR